MFVAVVIAVCLSATVVAAQIQYPFTDIEGNEDIRAYWYNVPVDSVSDNFQLGKKYFHSFLQVYGKALSDSFTIKERAWGNDGSVIYENQIEIVGGELVESLLVRQIEQAAEFGHPAYFDYHTRNGFFVLEHQVVPMEVSPSSIEITIESAEGVRTKKIDCSYRKLWGRVTDFDGKPFRAFVWINPDNFGSSAAVWCDSAGYYEIELPERTYNNIAVDDESYGRSTLESWAWHIIMDQDQQLNFKVGTGEVYNLNVWPNNGGGPTYFISFRPMVLVPQQQGATRGYDTTINGRRVKVSDLDPGLEIDDIRVKVNGSEMKILSLQKYYETFLGDTAAPAYIIQASSKGIAANGKKTIVVEYEVEMEIDGTEVVRQSMGQYQYLPNFSGLSKYY